MSNEFIILNILPAIPAFLIGGSMFCVGISLRKWLVALFGLVFGIFIWFVCRIMIFVV